MRQFVTRDGSCRRCHASLIMPEPQVEAPQQDQPTAAEAKPASWGRLLCELRRQKNLSQSQLAARADMPRTFISRLERRDGPPTYGSVVRISTALQVSASLFLDNAAMRNFLLQQVLFSDPFIAEIWREAQGLERDQLQVIEAAVKTLSEGQMPMQEWMRIAISENRLAGA
jgi:transcriptional regulator with XRE-family HTH domain